MGGLVNFFSPWWKGVLGACSGPKWPTLAHLEHPEKVLSFKKEAERGWKSGARSLSWKSDWKPSISRSFCAIGTYCIFFRLEVTAVWKKKCRYKQISFTKSLLLLKGHFQSSFIIPFQCSITYVWESLVMERWKIRQARWEVFTHSCHLIPHVFTFCLFFQDMFYARIKKKEISW